MEEWGWLRTVVSKEADDGIVAQRDHVNGVAQEKGNPVVARYEWPKDELDNVEKDPDRKEGSDRDLSTATVSHCPRLRSARFPLTSKQYPNSSTSPSPSPGLLNSPACLLLPGKPCIPGPNNLPTRKKAVVATSTETSRKCTNTNSSVSRNVEANEGVEAIPQAMPVSSMKKERR